MRSRTEPEPILLDSSASLFPSALGQPRSKSSRKTRPEATGRRIEREPPGYTRTTLRVLDQPSQPVLILGDPRTAGNLNGFESGTVVEMNKLYYLFILETVGDSLGIKMQLAAWTSRDGTAWTRVLML